MLPLFHQVLILDSDFMRSMVLLAVSPSFSAGAAGRDTWTQPLPETGQRGTAATVAQPALVATPIPAEMQQSSLGAPTPPAPETSAPLHQQQSYSGVDAEMNGQPLAGPVMVQPEVVNLTRLVEGVNLAVRSHSFCFATTACNPSTLVGEAHGARS